MTAPLALLRANERFVEVVASLLVRRSGRFRRFAVTYPDAPPRQREVLNLVTLLSGVGLWMAVGELLAHLNIHWR